MNIIIDRFGGVASGEPRNQMAYFQRLAYPNSENQREMIMSTKASIISGDRYHLYFQELLSVEPKNVYLELNQPSELSFSKETIKGRTVENLVVEIPSEMMDEIAIAWIKKRKLQGAVGGPVGQEWGSPDCPWD